MPNEPENKRVVAFIDGQSLFHAARTKFGYQTPNYDVQALARAACSKQSGWNLIQTRFYTGVPLQSKSPRWHGFWTYKLHVMRSNNIHVFTRELGYATKTVALPDGQTEDTCIAHEKGVDIRIALDVIKLAYQKAYDVALIFSQDQDLTEVVDDVREIAKQQVRWIEIASAFPFDPEADRNRGINKTTWIEIDRATYDTCIDPHDYFPQVIPEVQPQSDEEIFLAELEAACGWTDSQYARHVLMLANIRFQKFQWQTGRETNWVVALYQHQNYSFPLLMMSTDGTIRIPTRNKGNRPIFRGKDSKVDLLRSLNTIPGISIPEENYKEEPQLQISCLLDTDLVDSLLAVIDGLIERVKATSLPEPEKNADSKAS